MVAVTTPIASLPPTLSPSPSPAPTAVDSSPHTGGNRQNAPSASIEGSYENQKHLWIPNMKLKLYENIQFIYELALAQKELKALGIEFKPTNDLRGFVSRNSVDPELLKRRLAYFESINGCFSDYYYIQKYNQTGSVNQYLTHWIYPYKGNFHPQKIRSLLNITGTKPGDAILDPFIGSGTTAVKTQLLGINCVGIDVSPLCVLISKVKTESMEVLDKILEYGHSVAPSTRKLSQSALFTEINIENLQDGKVKNFYKMAEMIAFSNESRRHKDFLKSYHSN